ncbi:MULTISPECIES: C40 family peptidase [unclassified Psychrobacillus]|uniref:C40 family peptidase n=1 Tax=unclassified Psychrobacillus TaxID=2636677 RepID=UPI0030F5C662
MKMKTKTITLTLIASLAFGQVAFADQGVFLKDTTIPTAPLETTIKKGESFTWNNELLADPTVTVNGQEYAVPLDSFMQTHQTKLVDKKVEPEVVIHSEGGLLSLPLLTTTGLEKVMKEAEGGLVEIQTLSGQSGWISSENVFEVTTEVPISTKAYSIGDAFPFGTELELSGFNGKEYEANIKDKLHLISEENVSFKAPSQFDELYYYASKELGKPYIWGGNGEVGFDCSGYTTEMFKKLGIELPRTALTQSVLGKTVTEYVPGDLLFFETYKPGASHVAIYIGDGKMIHAAGKKVHIAPIDKPYWKERFLFAKRIL